MPSGATGMAAAARPMTLPWSTAIMPPAKRKATLLTGPPMSKLTMRPMMMAPMKPVLRPVLAPSGGSRRQVGELIAAVGDEAGYHADDEAGTVSDGLSYETGEHRNHEGEGQGSDLQDGLPEAALGDGDAASSGFAADAQGQGDHDAAADHEGDHVGDTGHQSGVEGMPDGALVVLAGLGMGDSSGDLGGLGFDLLLGPAMNGGGQGLLHEFGRTGYAVLNTGDEARLPSKRDRSTSVSAAMMTASASRISSAVSSFSTPIDPWVSTLIWSPASLAVSSNFSAAMYVWAIPVGHAVIPMYFFIVLLDVGVRSPVIVGPWCDSLLSASMSDVIRSVRRLGALHTTASGSPRISSPNQARSVMLPATFCTIPIDLELSSRPRQHAARVSR